MERVCAVYSSRIAVRDPPEIDKAAMELGTQPDLVVMDCIGYTMEMKRAVEEATDASVLLARSVLAKTISEMVSVRR